MRKSKLIKILAKKKKRRKNKVKIFDLKIFAVFVVAAVFLVIIISKTEPSESPSNEIKDSVLEDNGALFSIREEYKLPSFLIGAFELSDEEIEYPIAVAIDNLDESRPQAGLARAAVVYETLAEGDITRFLAIFSSDDEAESIGPVRSARPYHLELAAEHGALFVHSGGSPEALGLLRSAAYSLINLDEFANGQYFWRSRKRVAPHNLYTSLENLRGALAKRKKYEIRELSPWLWSEILDNVESHERVSKVTIPFSKKKAYEVVWIFDEDRGVWQRYYSGELSRMDDGSVIEVTNLVIQFANMRVVDDEGRRKIDLIGSGKAFLFRDGVEIPAKWEKSSVKARTRFYGIDGRELAFAPGKVWISIVARGTELSFE